MDEEMSDYWLMASAAECIYESELISESDDYIVLSIPRSLWDSYKELDNGN